LMAKEKELSIVLKLPEKTKVEIPKEVFKRMVELNPDREAAIKQCVAGVWADRWVHAITGITREEAERVPALKEVRERALKRLCTKLYEALGV